jgi:predicted dehydrogenase
MYMNAHRFSRRQFLRRTAGLGISLVTFPTLIPASALGRDGSVAPSNRVAVGCIGVGSRGRDDLGGFLNQKSAQVVAVCDVHSGQLERARQIVNDHYRSNDCAGYGDFRELVARKDIDACLIATGERWHVLTAMAAVRAGKDVYVEKPLGLSVTEDRMLREEVHRLKRVFQFGTQQRSDRKFRFACELARNQRIGQLKHINVWCPGSIPGGPAELVPPPPELNYDLWLGQSPTRPYSKDLAETSRGTQESTWRFIADFTTGFVAGWGIHPLDIAVWGAEPELFAGPLEVEGRGTFHSEGVCDTATIWNVRMKAASGLTVLFVGAPYSYGKPTGEPWPQEQEWKQRYGEIENYGTAFEGTDGWVHVDRERIHFHPENLVDESEDSFHVQLLKSPHHIGHFLDCVRSRGETVSPVAEAVRGDTLCHLSDIAMRLNRKVVWDPQQERFIDDPEADLRLVRRMRAPWQI